MKKVTVIGDIIVALRYGYVESLNPVTVIYDGKKYDIPVGQKSNFASIPWFGRWAISPVDPDIMSAAYVHDALCGEFGPAMTDWRHAAEILRVMMKEAPYQDPTPGLTVRGRMINFIFRQWRRFKRVVVYRTVMANGIATGRAEI